MDALGFEEWYRVEHPKLISALTVVARDVSTAAEIVDEAFVRAYERLSRDEKPTSSSFTGPTTRTPAKIAAAGQMFGSGEHTVAVAPSR